MAARDGAASIQGDAIRITPLNVDGSIDTNKPILTTNGFISASFGTEFEDGDEITEKAADGSICIQFKADDSMKGITFNLSLCSPDPEASALIAGGKIICAATDILTDPTAPPGPDNPICQSAGTVIGYTSPAVGATVGNPVAIEIWSKAIVRGKPAACTPYYHWVFPYVRVRYEGDREFTNGALANEFTGTGVGNDALTANGLNPAMGAGEDFVTYRAALTNPFSYVRSQSKPNLGWTGAWTYTPDNSLGCGADLATGATAGTPGFWTPVGSVAPETFTELSNSTIQAEPPAQWQNGQHVVLGDATQAYWDGNQWQVGAAPAGPATGATEVPGAAGTWTPTGATPPSSVANLQAGNPATVTASPSATAWGTGSFMQTGTAGTAGQAYWNGTAWTAGVAP